MLRDPFNQTRIAFVPMAMLVASQGRLGEAFIILVLLGGTMLPRLLGIPRPFEGALLVGLSLQAVGGAFGLFRPDFGWDILVHTVLTGAAAPCAYLALVRIGALPDPSAPEVPENHDVGVLLITAALGMALGATWEIVEGTSDQLLGTSLVRSSLDTTIDLIANAMGAVVGGAALVSWARRTRTEERTATEGQIGPSP
jgi:hypothetical protein